MEFKSRWFDFSPDQEESTDKTDKSQSDVPELPKEATDKTDRSTFVSDVSSDFKESEITPRQECPTVGSETFNDPRDLADVLGFDARLIGELPLPPIAVLTVEDFGSTVFDFRPLSSSRRRVETKHPFFDLDEIEALIEGVENERCGTQGFCRVLQKKVANHDWRLTREIALAGSDRLLKHPPKPRGWSLGQILDAIGAQLRMIRINGLQSERRDSNAEAK